MEKLDKEQEYISKKEKIRSIFRVYNKVFYTFFGFLCGFLGYFPFFRFIRLIMYLISVMTLCASMTGKKKRFNILLFLFILLFIFLFASTFMSTVFYAFSAVPGAPPKIDYPEFDIESFNYTLTMDSIDSFFAPIFFFLLVGIPAIAIAGAIWAVVVGQINEAIKTILKIFFVVLFVGTSVLILNNFGVRIPGLSDAVLSISNLYINSISSIYIWLTGGSISGDGDINGETDPNSFGYFLTGEDQETRYEDRDSSDTYTDKNTGETKIAGDLNGDGEVGPIEDFFYNLNLGGSYFADALRANSETFHVGIASCIPLISSFMNLFFMFIFMSEKARKWTEAFFDNVNFSLSLSDEEEKEFHLFNFNYRIILFVIIIIFSAFMMFLQFVKLYRETGIIEFTQIGYLSIYLIMITTSVIFLSMPNLTIYTKSNIKNTFYGTILGLGFMFVGVQFIVGTSYTLSAYSYEYDTFIWYQILNTFIFIAPAETFFFHIFVPSIFVGWLYKKGNKKITKDFKERMDDKINRIESDLETLKMMKDAYMKGTKEMMNVVDEMNNKSRIVDGLNKPLKLKKDFMFVDFNSYLMFIIMIVIVNVFFSITHFVLSDLDIFVFWLSGLGFVYLVGGIIITLISWKYGWISGIAVHTLNNILSIFMTMIYVGGSLV